MRYNERYRNGVLALQRIKISLTYLATMLDISRLASKDNRLPTLIYFGELKSSRSSKFLLSIWIRDISISAFIRCISRTIRSLGVEKSDTRTVRSLGEGEVIYQN